VSKLARYIKAIKVIKLTVAWSLNCLHVIVCVALRCPGNLTVKLSQGGHVPHSAALLYFRNTKVPKKYKFPASVGHPCPVRSQQ